MVVEEVCSIPLKNNPYSSKADLSANQININRYSASDL